MVNTVPGEAICPQPMAVGYGQTVLPPNEWDRQTDGRIVAPNFTLPLTVKLGRTKMRGMLHTQSHYTEIPAGGYALIGIKGSWKGEGIFRCEESDTRRMGIQRPYTSNTS